MNFFDVLQHGGAFLAPAAAVALGLALLDRWISGKKAVLLQSITLNFAVGSMALLGGLLTFGVDGKMATYALLVASCGSTQWWLSRRR